MAKKKTARKNKKKSATKTASKKKLALKMKPATKKPVRRKKPARRPAEVANPVTPQSGRGLGPDSGGQSGDVQGLSRKELADSESIEELSEEGQDYEAGIVSGVENAPDADEGPVKTREVPENDVPGEYLDEQ